MNTNNCQTWEQFIRKQIPIATAMDLHFKHYDGNSLVLTAPLSANINHHGTAFGGSLYALAAVAGWGFLSMKLAEENIHADIVIHQAQVNYPRPVTQNISINCRPADISQWNHFLHCYQSRHKARIKLLADACQDTETCMHFEGDFVALQPSLK